MGFTTAVRTCLGKYADLTGRAGRGETWWFALALFLVVVGVPVVGGVLASVTDASGTILGGVVVTTLSVVWAVVVLALVLPAVAVGVRRLHDTGRSGWWWWVGVVPVVGAVVLAVLWTRPGTPGPNRFGTAEAGTPLWPARERG